MIKISVVCPIYKGKKYVSKIVKQIENCKANSDRCEFELVFVNDFPFEKIEDVVSNVIDIKVLNTEINRGIHGARVRGLNFSEGEYIHFLDQDDNVNELFYESQLEAMRDADAVVCALKDHNKNYYNDGFIMSEVVNKEYMLTQKNSIITPGQVLLKKKSIPKIWIENILKVNGADDYFLWLCMWAENKKIVLNNTILFEHVIHSDNMSFDSNVMMDSENEMIRLLINNNSFCGVDLIRLKNLPTILRKYHIKDLEIYKYACDIYRLTFKRGNDVRINNIFKSVAIYGAAEIGIAIKNSLSFIGVTIEFFIDRNANSINTDIPIFTLENSPLNVETIIVAVNRNIDEIIYDISQKYKVKIYTIYDYIDILT